MNKIRTALIVLFLLIVNNTMEVVAGEVVWEELSRGKADLNTVIVQKDNPKVIYIGAKGGIFKTQNSGQTWRTMFSVRGQNNDVRFLLFDPSNKEAIFAAAGSGLYYSDNRGGKWSRIFRGKSYPQGICTALAVTPDRIYLGTKAGLFLSKDLGRSWRKVISEASGQVVAVCYNSKDTAQVYAAFENCIYKTNNNGESWEKVFSAGASIEDNKAEIEEETDEDGKENARIRYLISDSANPDIVYAATSAGVYKSSDKTISWQAISNYGLLSKDIRFLLVSHDRGLFAATRSGVFEYAGGRWNELSLRLLGQDIKSLDSDNQGNLYAVCGNGLFKAQRKYSDGYLQNSITEIYYKDEPEIHKVQKIAIEYAEVNPEKIMRWRKQAAAKACLPKVSAGINRDTGDLWHWESGSTTKTGDDVLTRGRDTLGWSVTLSWDLGEIIWNDAQTSIDARSRLSAQLRDEILDEVNKLYFERLRVKMDLDRLSIEDRKARFEKELRLKELAAYLDALTGGYFSTQLKNNAGL